MNRMGAYVWARRGVLAAFLGCVLIFWLVFSLYELPGEAVLYAALLSSIWLLGLGVWDALRFSGRLRALQELRRDIDVTDAMPQDLPKAWDAVEQAYRELLFPSFHSAAPWSSEAAGSAGRPWTITRCGCTKSKPPLRP